MELLDKDGYPTVKFLRVIKTWKHDSNISLEDLLGLIEEAWCYRDIAFKRRQPRNGYQTIEMHTVGWSGSEDIINAILSNLWLTQFRLRYVKWYTGGHHYFKFKLFSSCFLRCL